MSQVEIYNQALSLIGSGRRLVSPTDTGREAQDCNLWYPDTRRAILSAAWWPSSKATSRLALVAERSTSEIWAAGDPSPQYLYAYALPADYIWPRQLASGEHFTVEMLDGNQMALMTNSISPVLQYTFDQTSDDLWSPLQKQAISHVLAARIVLGLTGKSNRAQLLFQMAQDLVQQARAQSGNTDHVRYDVLPDWIAIRDYEGTPEQTRFIYPYNDLSFGAML